MPNHIIHLGAYSDLVVKTLLTLVDVLMAQCANNLLGLHPKVRTSDKIGNQMS